MCQGGDLKLFTSSDEAVIGMRLTRENVESWIRSVMNTVTGMGGPGSGQHQVSMFASEKMDPVIIPV